jgi:hypothetical protein
MQTKTVFTQEQIEEYLPNIQDKMAASMLKLLLSDVNQLESQVRLQKERMNMIHGNLQKYTDDVIKRVMHLPGNGVLSMPDM